MKYRTVCYLVGLVLVFVSSVPSLVWAQGVYGGDGGKVIPSHTGATVGPRLCDLPAWMQPSGGLPSLAGQALYPDPPRDIPVDPPIDPAEACTASVWVGLMAPGVETCPNPSPRISPSWTITQLFGADAPPALQPFCLYEYDGDDALALGVLNKLLADEERLARVDQGCVGVAPAPESQSNTDELWEDLEWHFLDQAGAGPGVPMLPWYGSNQGVRVAVVDTQPTYERDRPGPSPHGFSLMRMIERLVCGPSKECPDPPDPQVECVPQRNCPVEIDPYLALRIEKWEADEVVPPTTCEFGGHFGMIHDLATAVWEALGGADALHAKSREPLVINLSVAWVGELFGGLERKVSDMPVPVQAVHRALEVASCRGALVVAAAGNRVGGPMKQNGPMLPGGWERRPAPDAKDCERLLGSGVIAQGERRPWRWRREPLVYAGGGIVRDGSPLPISRNGAGPRLLAYSDHAVVKAGYKESLSCEAPDGDEIRKPAGRTEIYTGTSVAAAAISAIAAGVWTQYPNLRRRELMEVLARSGEPVGRRADFSRRLRWWVQPMARRIEWCSALALACEEAGGAACPRCPEHSLANFAIPLGMSTPYSATTLTETGYLPAFCGGQKLYFRAGNPPIEPCPERQFHGITARAWTRPQPQVEPCPSCTVRPPPMGPAGTLELQIDIDTKWNNGVDGFLEEATLKVGVKSFFLDLGTLGANATRTVPGFDVGDFKLPNGKWLPVTLHFLTSKGKSVVVPVFIVP